MSKQSARVPLIAGNWKMHKTIAEARAFVDALLPPLRAAGPVDVVICPAYLALRPTVERTRGSGVEVYAQNMHYATSGPFTGEVSAPMLVEAGVRGVILGHSERRRLFAESDEAVQLKAAAATDAGLIPIVCVGEMEDECGLGETEQRIGERVRTALARVDERRLGDVAIAYEPSWPIGTGRLVSSARVQEVSEVVRSAVAERSAEQAERVRVLYGGSVTPTNAAALTELGHVDGLLVGEASLDPGAFAAIVAGAAAIRRAGASAVIDDPGDSP